MTPRGHAARPDRQANAHVAGRRLAIVVVLVAVVVGVALIDRTAPPPAPAAPSALSAMTIPAAGAPTSSWYCTGSTTGFGAQANTTIYVTNTGTRTVAGTVSTTVNTGKAPASSHQTISVPADGAVAVNPGINAPVGYGATTLTFAGGGIAVTQVAAGPDGWSTAPCASVTSSSWYFATGATTAGNQLVLALYNPTSTDAVANVSFDTEAGVVTPQLYQGLTVPAGQLVVENVGDYVQNRSTIATVVNAQSGQIVADQLQLTSTSGRSGLSLALGAPTVRPTWYFAQSTNPSGTGSSVSLLLSNPGHAGRPGQVGRPLRRQRGEPDTAPDPLLGGPLLDRRPGPGGGPGRSRLQRCLAPCLWDHARSGPGRRAMAGAGARSRDGTWRPGRSGRQSFGVQPRPGHRPGHGGPSRGHLGPGQAAPGEAPFAASAGPSAGGRPRDPRRPIQCPGGGGRGQRPHRCSWRGLLDRPALSVIAG